MEHFRFFSKQLPIKRGERERGSDRKKAHSDNRMIFVINDRKVSENNNKCMIDEIITRKYVFYDKIMRTTNI